MDSTNKTNVAKKNVTNKKTTTTLVRRHDKSFFGEWLNSLDMWLIFAFFSLMLISLIMVFYASTAEAERINASLFHFVNRQVIFLFLASCIVFVLSIFSSRQILLASIALLAGSLILTFATKFIGYNIKGASRWIYIASFSLQPSEFLKPSFAVVASYLLSHGRIYNKISSFATVALLYGTICVGLILQPDFGMTVTISLIFALQLFLSGLPWLFVFVMTSSLLGGGFAAFKYLPHVHTRIMRFLHKGGYQVEKSLDAFANGGLFGQGAGMGKIKYFLPDSHTDFIYAVIAEELGAFTACLVILIFLFIVLRSLYHAIREESFFIFLSITSLTVLLFFQSTVNLASTMALIPTKGMTLPFISYGGSSMVSVAITSGFILALTRKSKH